MRRLVGAGLLWSFTALAAGAASEPDGYWTGDVDAPVPATIRGGSVIHAKEVAALLRHPGMAIVDVSNAPRRPSELAPGAPWLPLPHRALPGAQWIPGTGGGVLAPEIDNFFRSRLDMTTGGNLDAPVVVYCHDKCWLSWNAAKRAIGYGYRRIYWFPEGIEGWRASGRPTVVVEPLTMIAGPQPKPKLPSLAVPAPPKSPSIG